MAIIEPFDADKAIGFKIERDILKAKIDGLDTEIHALQDKIDELEGEVDLIVEEKRPLSKRLIDIEYELGIRVDKNQMKLFEENK